MGFKFIKHLESTNYNRKLFYLDRGAIDLPPILDRADIQPGSEARSLLTGDKWVLNSEFKWMYIDPNADNDGASQPEPVIEGIVITPTMATVALESKIIFTAKVEGSEELSKAVVWSIKGNKSAETTISHDGILEIAEDETAQQITVRVTSVADKEVYAQAIITIDEEALPEPVVTGLIIYPVNTTVLRGKNVMFGAIVSGINDFNKGVIWSISGNQSNSTQISPDGILTVYKDELSSAVVIKATSRGDSNIYATAMASIESESTFPGDIPQITQIKIQPQNINVGVGLSAQFAVDIIGVHNPSNIVIWELTGKSSEDTRITPDGLAFVGEDETGTHLTIRATSAEDPTKFAQAVISVIMKDDPEYPEDPKPTVSAVLVSPSALTMEEDSRQVFKATVLGQNNPSQAVKWELKNANIQTTTLSNIGVLTVGKGETAKTLEIIVTSIADSTKKTTVYVSIGKKVVLPETGIEEIPTNPINQEYVRRMEASGKGGWVPQHFADINDFNKLKEEVGAVSKLTTDKKIVVEAINEVDAHADEANRRLTAIASQDASVDIVHKPNGNIDFSVQRIANTKPDRTELTSVVTGVDTDATKLTATLKLAVYNATTKKVEQVNKALKLVSSAQAGYMTGDMYDLFRTALQDIEDLKGLGGDFLGLSFATYEEFAAYGPPPTDSKINDYVYILKDETHNNETTLYRVIKQGEEKVFAFAFSFGSNVGNIANDTTLGIVKGSADIDENKGKIYVEIDGTMSLIGWDEITQAIGALQTFVNETLPSIYAPLDSPEFVGTPTVPTAPDYAVNKEVINAEWIARNVKRYTLGDKLDILYILDLGDHSTYLKNIVTLADFDATEKRYELYTSPSAWHLVTELHPGYWEEVLKQPDWCKMIVGMDNATGAVKIYYTSFTDDHEFEQLLIKPIFNPEPYPNTLTWTNTVGKANTFTVSDGTHYRRYEFDRNNLTLKVSYSEEIPPSTEPGVSPWATVIGEYSLMADGSVIGPLAGVTDQQGYLWVSERENFMVGSAGNGTQMFVYSMDDETSYIFDVPSGNKDTYQLVTDINEKYFVMYVTEHTAVWVDRKNKRSHLINWRSPGISIPDAETRPCLSPDGQYYCHTSTNPSTYEFYFIDTTTGEDVATGGQQKGTSSAVIMLRDNRTIVLTNTEGKVFSYLKNGENLSQNYSVTPFAGYYVLHTTDVENELLFIKGRSGSGPLWYTLNALTGEVISQSSRTNVYGVQTNGQGKSFCYPVSYEGVERYLITDNNPDEGFVIERQTFGTWIETQLPFGGMSNNQHQYNQPLLMENGRVLVTQDKDGNPTGYDLVTKNIVDLEELKPQPEANLVQIDNTHMMWCGQTGSQLLRVTSNETKVIYEIPEQQVLVYGFKQTL